jgi:hypothetical protein
MRKILTYKIIFMTLALNLQFEKNHRLEKCFKIQAHSHKCEKVLKSES